MKRLLPVLMGFGVLLVCSTKVWSLPPCADFVARSIQEVDGWDTCFGRLLIEKGEDKGWSYVGEFMDGTVHGKGVANWPEGDQYVGEVAYGKVHGQGTYTFPDGRKYVGELRYGQPNGLGTMTSADGKVEKGVWRNGKFQPWWKFW